jgi:hypothetical protein
MDQPVGDHANPDQTEFI